MKDVRALAVCAGQLFVWLASANDLPSPPQQGTFTLTIKSSGFDRMAQIHIPKGYKSEARPPLVLVFHGAGGSGAGASK